MTRDLDSRGKRARVVSLVVERDQGWRWVSLRKGGERDQRRHRAEGGARRVGGLCQHSARAPRRRKMRAASGEQVVVSAAGGAASALILRAAVWSPEAHELFPSAARARAVILLKLGHLLARSPRFAAEAGSLVDAWVGFVLPHAIVRGAAA